MKHPTNDEKFNQVDDSQPLFTVRDTCIGLAACLGVGLLTSVALSAIILLLSANAQAVDNPTAYSESYEDANSNYDSDIDHSSKNSDSVNSENLNIIGYSTPEEIISQKCDAHIGQLKNINIGDKLAFQNEGSIQQDFLIIGIQVIEEQPEVMPIVDESSMLTMITCYPSDNRKLDLAVSYLVMIQEITANQNKMEQGLAHVSHKI